MEEVTHSKEKVAAVKKTVHELEAKLKGDLLEDAGLLSSIRRLRESVGLYVTEFTEEGCVYCSG